MFWFSKKVEPVQEVEQVEYVDIPTESVLAFWELYDKLQQTGRRADKYKLWTFIETVLPETKNYRCSIDDTYTRHPRIGMKIPFPGMITSGKSICRHCGN